MKDNNRKVLIFGSRLHRRVMLMIFIATIIPTIVIGTCLYYLIFNLTAEQIGIPEMMFAILIPTIKKVNTVILFILPLCLLFIWLWAAVISHRIVGPLERMANEIDDRIAGRKKGQIRIREKDSVGWLADKINLLLERLQK